MPVEWNELRLMWPPELFRREAEALLQSGAQDEETVGWLLDEAFHGGRALQLYREYAQWERATQMAAVAGAVTAIGTGDRPAPYVSPQAQLFDAIVRAAEDFPRWERKRLYSERRNPSAPRRWSMADLKVVVVRALRDMDGTGYFEDAFGSRCPDRWDNPDARGQQLLGDAVDQHDERLWPLSYAADGLSSIEDEWGDELFLDLIEALHDQVARPRRRYWHGFHAEHDYDTFSRSAGQAVYRWRINELLARSEVNLRLAGSGPDAGYLVQVTGDPRDELLEQALTTPDATDRSEVQHAVTLYRARGATREDKRSAVVALARVLEHRRPLLKDTLPRKDEGALFQIANEFDLRHRRPGQRGDYGEAFLDWLFWWYLATIDLTNRLLDEQNGSR
ncbi:hypothetical protein [Blastococcus sp. LR1]|uniref:hypothetical protein n=1 Tax=Blastococcus sp. LR1 TaxID=2877000 RepID=UPI001CC960D3|nr:hypothetical protein [Blastococcus sp. LR1]MCA0143962.1 hypothetical protein [Blastococcus sp. LR1]